MTLHEFVEYDQLKYGSKEEKYFLDNLIERPKLCNGDKPKSRQMCENCDCIDGMGIVCCDKGQHMMHMYQYYFDSFEQYEANALAIENPGIRKKMRNESYKQYFDSIKRDLFKPVQLEIQFEY